MTLSRFIMDMLFMLAGFGSGVAVGGLLLAPKKDRRR